MPPQASLPSIDLPRCNVIHLKILCCVAIWTIGAGYPLGCHGRERLFPCRHGVHLRHPPPNVPVWLDRYASWARIHQKCTDRDISEGQCISDEIVLIGQLFIEDAGEGMEFLVSFLEFCWIWIAQIFQPLEHVFAQISAYRRRPLGQLPALPSRDIGAHL